MGTGNKDGDFLVLWEPPACRRLGLFQQTLEELYHCVMVCIYR